MRVLIIADSFGIGGKERQVVELLKGFRRRGDLDVLAVCLDQGEFYEPAISALKIPLKHAVRKARWDPLVFREVHRIVGEFAPDVIHTNGLLSSFYALPSAKWLGVPLINGSIRNAFRHRTVRWRIERMLLSFSDIRIANSGAGLRSRGFLPESGRDFVIYNGFDLERVRQFPIRQDNSRPADAANQAVVGMVAEFNPYKDYATFVAAALKLLAVRDDVTFVTVGDGETLDATRQLVPSGCDRIKFLGRREDVEAIISRFSIGVLATFTEGLSNAIMEYMALGKPVIATDGGGSNELVVEGRTGLLVPQGNADALARAIGFLLDRPNVARVMGEAGRQRLESHFSLETMVEKTVSLYQYAVAHSNRRSGSGAFA